MSISSISSFPVLKLFKTDQAAQAGRGKADNSASAAEPEDLVEISSGALQRLEAAGTKKAGTEAEAAGVSAQTGAILRQSPGLTLGLAPEFQG